MLAMSYVAGGARVRHVSGPPALRDWVWLVVVLARSTSCCTTTNSERIDVWSQSLRLDRPRTLSPCRTTTRIARPRRTAPARFGLPALAVADRHRLGRAGSASAWGKGPQNRPRLPAVPQRRLRVLGDRRGDRPARSARADGSCRRLLVALLLRTRRCGPASVSGGWWWWGSPPSSAAQSLDAHRGVRLAGAGDGAAGMPFVSYGGSSTMSAVLALALALGNVARRQHVVAADGFG